MAKHTVVFEGIPSGDHECFCWDVDQETFKRIEGYDPEPDLSHLITQADIDDPDTFLKQSDLGRPWQEQSFDRSHFHEGLYRLYPGAVMPGKKKKQRFTIIVEDIEE